MYDGHSIYYTGDHAIEFDGLNTWSDFHLAPTALPIPEPPAQKTNVVDIVGADGSIDLSNILTGYPTYQNRNGSFEFVVAPGYENWVQTYSKVVNFLHGKKRKMVLTDDPLYVYTGTFTVSMSQDGPINNISIGYDLEPYKKLPLSVGEIYPEVFKTVQVDSESYIDVIPDIKNYLMEMPAPMVVAISSDNGLYIRYWNSDYNTFIEKGPLPTGTYRDPDFTIGAFSEDVNVGFQVKGRGTIRIDFTQGRL